MALLARLEAEQLCVAQVVWGVRGEQRISQEYPRWSKEISLPSSSPLPPPTSSQGTISAEISS